MLSVSLHCLFWIISSFLCLGPTVVCVSTLSILDYHFCSVSGAHCCLCLYIFYSGLLLLFCVWCPLLSVSLHCLFWIISSVRCLVPTVVCVSTLSILDYHFCSVSGTQYCPCLYIVYSGLSLLFSLTFIIIKQKLCIK